MADPAPHHHHLVQAPVAPLDVDGINVVTVGTALFAIGGVLTFVFLDPLTAAGREWWLGVSVSGFVLGIVGLVYCLRLRRRRLDQDAP